MKRTKLRIAIPALLGVSMLLGCGNDTASTDDLAKTAFKVSGNCGMCEKTIEASLNGSDGIGTADWDKETKMITVTYDADKMTEDQMKEKIAGVGYDSETHKADEAVYAALPGCCQYDREN
jgi:copper chaperone CopZ